LVFWFVFLSPNLKLKGAFFNLFFYSLIQNSRIHPNAYDGHTLHRGLLQAEKLSGTKVKYAFLDRGYRGNNIPVNECNIFISGTKRGITPALKKAIKRRSAIEPHIGHMKSDGKLSVNYLKGILGDKLNVILCAISHNLKLITRKLFLKPSQSHKIQLL